MCAPSPVPVPTFGPLSAKVTSAVHLAQFLTNPVCHHNLTKAAAAFVYPGRRCPNVGSAPTPVLGAPGLGKGCSQTGWGWGPSVSGLASGLPKDPGYTSCLLCLQTPPGKASGASSGWGHSAGWRGVKTRRQRVTFRTRLWTAPCSHLPCLSEAGGMCRVHQGGGLARTPTGPRNRAPERTEDAH